jgi:deoxyribonuclease V
MRSPHRHRWDLSIASARRLQERLRARIVEEAPAGFSPGLVAGADMSHRRGSPWLYGAVVVLRLADGAVLETVTVRRKAAFPYVPGFLTFREGPVLLDAFRRLHVCPDAVLFDGHGRAHPRRFGLACHLGLWLDLPSVGCAKSRLCGVHDEPGLARGSRAPLLDEGERIGTVLRTRDGSRPVFVSVGHRVDLATAEALVLRCSNGRRRLPDPTRLAHLAVNAFRQNAENAAS